MPETTYEVTVGKQVLRVRVRREANNDLLVRVDDGVERSVQLGTVRGPLRWLAIGDHNTELMAALVDDGVSIAVGGLELRAEVLDEARARLASVAGARAQSHVRRELKAPMPGLLVKVLVQAGDVVEAGQPLAVLQAMKMENELALPRGGTIKSIGAAPGQSVEQGQVLVVLE